MPFYESIIIIILIIKIIILIIIIIFHDKIKWGKNTSNKSFGKKNKCYGISQS